MATSGRPTGAFRSPPEGRDGARNRTRTARPVVPPRPAPRWCGRPRTVPDPGPADGAGPHPRAPAADVGPGGRAGEPCGGSGSGRTGPASGAQRGAPTPRFALPREKSRPARESRNHRPAHRSGVVAREPIATPWTSVPKTMQYPNGNPAIDIHRDQRNGGSAVRTTPHFPTQETQIHLRETQGHLAPTWESCARFTRLSAVYAGKGSNRKTPLRPTGEPPTGAGSYPLTRGTTRSGAPDSPPSRAVESRHSYTRMLWNIVTTRFNKASESW